MKENDLKNIWKNEVNMDIAYYSENELKDMVVKNAQKTIKRIYPGWIFHIVIIAVVALIVFRIVTDTQSLGLMLLYLAALIILSVCYPLWVHSAAIMKKYKYDVPVKQWLEYRIKEIEKTIRFNTKYDLFIYGGAFLVGFGFFLGFQFLYNSFNMLFIGGMLICFVVYFLIIRYLKAKNYNKTLEELKNLYKELEE